MIKVEKIKKSYDGAMRARNGLLHCYTCASSERNRKKTKKRIFCPKVCCICDSSIKHGEEVLLPIDLLKHEMVKHYLLFENTDWTDSPVNAEAKAQLKDQYTLRLPRILDRKLVSFQEQLSSYILSPRSYMKLKTVNGKQTPHLGSCSECYHALKSMADNRLNHHPPPPNGIASGLMCGYAPRILKELNQVELALISKARVNMHLFQYTAGAHKAIRGYHTLYYNDVEQTNKVMNYYSKLSKESSNEENSKFSGIVQVVLAGPFTSEQKIRTLKEISVDIDKVNRALKWLKKHNVLYQTDEINDEQITQPEIYDISEAVESQNSNVEQVIETRAIFPDGSPTIHNGGMETSEEFKVKTIEKIVTGDHTLIAKGSKNILRDYEGDNLLRAFPLLFPYGIGNRDHQGNILNSTKFYEHLAS